MKISVYKASEKDKDFIIYANRMIDKASYIEKSNLKLNIENDLFKKPKCVCLIAKTKGVPVGIVLFSKVYWADRGQGIYISQVFVEKEYRRNGILKLLIQKALNHYKDIKFFTCLVSKKNEIMLSCMEKLHCQDEGMTTFVVNTPDLGF